MVRMKPTPKPTTQPSVVRRESTMALILSVTVAKVYPGAMTGGLPERGACTVGSSAIAYPFFSSSGLGLRTAAR